MYMNKYKYRKIKRMKDVPVHNDYWKKYDPEFRRKERFKKLVFFFFGCAVVYFVCFNN